MADKSMNTVSLKVLVNNMSDKVIFVESDNYFIDVLFSFLTMPMGTIIRLSHRSQPLGIGCMDNLYGSVESFDSQIFRTEECRAMLLHPRNGSEYLLNNLKLKFDGCEPALYFMCSNSRCSISRKRTLSVSYYETVCCCCEEPMRKVSLNGGEGGGLFLRGPARFIISDDLQVMPPFTSASSDLVKTLGFTGWNSIEEMTINVEVDEVLNLLMCSLVSKMPLTETLLRHKSVSKLSNEILDEEIYIESRIVGDTMNEEEEEMSIKLIVSKSKKMVCYAEAGEDFVNLLFSFLTLPLGFILKQMKHNSLKGCIDQLYKSVQDLDEQYLKSNNHKEALVSPKLPPGFGYENHPLGIEEASHLFGMPVKSVKFIDPKSHSDKDDNARGFLKGPAMFIVTDSLNISPISAILGLSLLSQMNVPVTDTEVQVAHLGKREALRLLVASFVCDSALTSVFLRKPNRGFGCLGFLI